ncbi:MAG: 5-formyltetrahydrofolate cyclo-ligase [Acidimicrobiia bacterium]|nr:MAG: 5-formyltetrahydrofolate cyclo-ligase [Acidimicrobiia bacterium]
MPRRHDRDAGGDPALLDAKARLREAVWERMSERGVARFPGARDRIPNFVGAEAAAQRLAATDEWRAARTVKANPDSPQLPVRVRALEEGKLLYVAVPRLAAPDPFLVLDPAALADPPRRAATIAGARRSARVVAMGAMEPLDLVVTGCVAVTEAGERLGKGGGFADLELALAAAAGLVDRHTVVVTTVHDRQVLAAGEVPTGAHDVHVDLVVTPTRTIRCARGRGHRLPRLRWSELTDEKVAVIPLLSRLRAGPAPARRSRSARRPRG